MDVVIYCSMLVILLAPAVASAQKVPDPDALSVVDMRSLPGGSISVDGKLDDWKGATFRTLLNGDQVAARVALVHDDKNLYLAWDVQDASPLLNRGQDSYCHFKEGDCVDLMIGPCRPPPTAPVAGDMRVLLVPLGTNSVVVVYRQVAPGSGDDDEYTFVSPVRQVRFDSVKVVSGCSVVFRTKPGGYVCEARLPLAMLGIRRASGIEMLGDMGVMVSNPGGMFTERRSYLFNRFTSVTADLPSEAELTPAHWGVLRFQP